MSGKIKSIEQERAKAAYHNVDDVVKANVEWDDFKKKYDIKIEHDKLKKKYKSGVKKLPVSIKTNGLGQTLAFIKNRDDGWKIIYRQLTEWLQKKELIKTGNTDLLKEVINPETESKQYRELTIECISFLKWQRRFADGLMDDVEEES